MQWSLCKGIWLVVLVRNHGQSPLVSGARKGWVRYVSESCSSDSPSLPWSSRDSSHRKLMGASQAYRQYLLDTLGKVVENRQASGKISVLLRCGRLGSMKSGHEAHKQSSVYHSPPGSCREASWLIWKCHEIQIVEYIQFVWSTNSRLCMQSR